jgi:RNA polymerase sigma factor (sigma-70 family)
MSPLSVRRYRAERLLRNEFQGLRGAVLATVRARLRAAGVSLDAGDLEDCYAQAWHGLYMSMLEGRSEITNPAGWLALVTYRRAIDEHRARMRACQGREPAGDDRWHGRDVIDEVDDRERLRQLMEGLRARLGPRERQAAALCYLQGLSRADAAARMGVSEKRMRKLMDGSRSGTPGVAAKVGQLLETIRAGSFCAEQSSLMRALAFGILDPDGERYALAQAHQRDCPGCRAYVLSLRGLASVLPLPPLPLALGAGIAAGAGTTAAGSGAGAGAASGVAGAGGATGGGWLLAGGGLGAKLAVGCLLAVGVGASCIALTVDPRAPERAVHHRRVANALRAPVMGREEAPGPAPAAAGARPAIPPAPASVAPQQRGAARAAAAASTAPAGVPPALAPAARASREFGLEQPASASPGTSKHTRARIAHAIPGARRAAEPSAGEASGAADQASGARSTGTGSSTSSSAPAAASTPAPPESSGGGSSAAAPSSPSPAEREFGIG